MHKKQLCMFACTSRKLTVIKSMNVVEVLLLKTTVDSKLSSAKSVRLKALKGIKTQA